MRLLYRLSRSLRRAVLKHLDRFRAGRVSARYAKRAELLHYRLPHPTVLCTMHSPHIYYYGLLFWRCHCLRVTLTLVCTTSLLWLIIRNETETLLSSDVHVPARASSSVQHLAGPAKDGRGARQARRSRGALPLRARGAREDQREL
jgi:hypothetical protein